MRNLRTRVTTTIIPKLLLSLRKTIVLGTLAAMQLHTMTRIQAICPISMRPAYFGSRRISPVSSAPKSESWNTRPTADEAPSNHSETAAPDSNQEGAKTIHTAAFISHVLGQFEPHQLNSATNAMNSYEKADALDRNQIRWLSASL